MAGPLQSRYLNHEYTTVFLRGDTPREAFIFNDPKTRVDKLYL